jgi:two-component system, chemotaxis family, chemotaxis protein CheY
MQQVHKVLIVDDSALQADMLNSLLIDLGFKNVATAINGVHALEYFEEALLNGSAYSLVFLDIVMPEMNGQEALKRMRALEKVAGTGKNNKTTIIMTTSLNSPEDMITALIENDCTDYIVKPVDENLLKSMLVKYGLIE